MPKHNNAVPCNQNKKDFKPFIKTWFNQPGRKHRRQTNRQLRVSKAGTTPTDRLRPVVHCPTQQYNYKVRAGRGFTLEELRACKLTARAARTIGISVDCRRKNRSEEGLKTNVGRLNTFLGKLVVFPKNTKAKKGIAGIPNDTLRKDLGDRKIAASIKEAMPITNYRRVLV